VSGIRRRDFVILLGGTAVAWPLAARAQQSKIPTIGFPGTATPLTMNSRVAAFVQRLRELGWIENRTVAIEYRWAEGRSGRFAEIVAEFVRLKVDVIVTSGTPVVIAAKHATAVIPIRITRRFHGLAMSGSAIARSSAVCSSALWARASGAGLVGGEGFAVDASLIVANANKQRSTPGSQWNRELDAQAASRATKEYLATLDDAATVRLKNGDIISSPAPA
jgi:hypothetical protein